jgi:hypothetical protein
LVRAACRGPGWVITRAGASISGSGRWLALSRLDSAIARGGPVELTKSAGHGPVFGDINVVYVA